MTHMSNEIIIQSAERPNLDLANHKMESNSRVCEKKDKKRKQRKTANGTTAQHV